MKENVKEQREFINKQNLKDKGITLIALVVTIVILLILAGVTLSMSISQNGLFSRAKDAADQYKEAQEDEEDLIEQLAKDMETLSEDYSKYVGATVTGYNPVTRTAENPCTIGIITSGHTAPQNFTTDPNMKWRIWDYDGRTLRIIGDPTKDTLMLSGVAGYNNGVWAIEEICKECYSNGKSGVEVTSLKRSDIQKVSSYDYTQYKHKINDYIEVTDNSKGDEELIHFGESKPYSDGNTKYPQMWGDNDQKWTYGYDKSTNKSSGEDKECITWEDKGSGEGLINEEMKQSSNEIIFKQSYYTHNYTEEEFANKKYFDLIFKKAGGQNTNLSCWLGERYVHLATPTCQFGLVDVVGGKVVGYVSCRSNGTEQSTGALRSSPAGFYSFGRKWM